MLTGKGAVIDSTRPEGRLFYGIFAAFAEFERELIRERTVASIHAARRAGKRLGPPVRLDAEKAALAQRLIAEGQGKAAVARIIGVEPATLRRKLNGLRS